MITALSAVIPVYNRTEGVADAASRILLIERALEISVAKHSGSFTKLDIRVDYS